MLNGFVLQNMVILAYDNNDDSGWAQFLVFVIVAVIYALAGLIKKAKADKIELEDDKQLEETLDLQKLNFKSQKTDQPRKIQIKPHKPKRPAYNTTKAANLSEPIPAIYETLKTPSELTPKKVRKPLEDAYAKKSETIATPLQTPVAKASIKIKLDDVDELQKAIIYSEILGKPKSLRTD